MRTVVDAPRDRRESPSLRPTPPHGQSPSRASPRSGPCIVLQPCRRPRRSRAPALRPLPMLARAFPSGSAISSAAASSSVSTRVRSSSPPAASVAPRRGERRRRRWRAHRGGPGLLKLRRAAQWTLTGFVRARRRARTGFDGHASCAAKGPPAAPRSARRATPASSPGSFPEPSICRAGAGACDVGPAESPRWWSRPASGSEQGARVRTVSPRIRLRGWWCDRRSLQSSMPA